MTGILIFVILTLILVTIDEVIVSRKWPAERKSFLISIGALPKK